jgi:hypothetical protein
MKLLAIGVGLTLLLCSLPSAACAQQDLAKILVGKWEGQMAPSRIAGRAPIDLNRTLVIKEVNEKDGTWSATGEWGISGQRLGPVAIAIKSSGGETQLEFQSAGSGPVTLKLLGDKNLRGSTRPPRALEDRELKLEKKTE